MQEHLNIVVSVMSSPTPDNLKVFISYSHDSDQHKDRVLVLSDRLRIDGIDCTIDQYETSPPEGWARWCDRKIEEADFVLIACTQTYLQRFKGIDTTEKGKGVKWEGAIITQEIYEAQAKNKKFIPIIFTDEDETHIPTILRGVTSYKVFTKEGYESLYRHLTSQPAILKPELGERKSMPPRERKQDILVDSKKEISKTALWNMPSQPNQFFTKDVVMWNEIRFRQLEENIQKDVGLLNKFEEELRYETNPRRMEGYEREIKRQRDSIERWQKEYKELLYSSFKQNELPTVSGAINRLKKDELLRVGSMMGAVETGRMPEKEIVETLEAIKDAMERIGKQKMPDEVSNAAKMMDDPKLDSAHKLKVSIPIIPTILSYETQLEVKGGLNLRKIWDGFWAKVHEK